MSRTAQGPTGENNFCWSRLFLPNTLFGAHPSLMRRPSYALAALVAAFLIVASSASASDYVPGKVIVKYKHGATRVVRAKAQRSTHTAFAARLPAGSHELRVTGDQSVPATIAALKKNRNVEYAVPDYVAHASYVPNDPGF